MQAARDRPELADLRDQGIARGIGRPRSTGGDPRAQRAHHVLPAVPHVDHELLQHGERGAAVRALVLAPAGQARHVAEPRPDGEEARDLDVGIQAGLRPAQGLEHEPGPQHHRGVALLTRMAVGRDLVRIGRESPAGRRMERDAAVLRGEPPARGDRGEDAPGEARIVVSVHHRLAAGPRDRGRVGRLGGHRHRDVVAVAVDVEEQEDEGPLGIEGGPVLDRQRSHPAGLGREPPLAGEEPRQIGAARAGEQRHDLRRIRAERPRCHRTAAPTGAAASGTSSSRRGRG